MESVSSHPVLTCGEAKAWEKRVLKDEAQEWQAMQKAGEQLAYSIFSDFKEIGGFVENSRVLVLVGKGHNGGDALLAAKVILEKYPQAVADVLFCFGESALRPFAGRALSELQAIAGNRYRSIKFEQLKAELTSYDLCIDGIFGFQFRLPIEEAIAGMAAWINAHPRIKFRAAVDLPSGLGEANGSAVFRADFTYATGIVKTPVVDETNLSYVGRLRYLDLGFFDAEAPRASTHILTADSLEALAGLRSPQSDKRKFGHLCVLGGSHNYPGAVVLAVRAALRSGVGLVTAFVPEQLAPHYAALHPEVMWVGCPLNAAGGLNASSLPLLRGPLKRATAMLIGPGLAADPETIELVRQLTIEVKVPVLFDADALRPEIIREVQEKPFVCTPHAGEFKRIAPALYEGDKFKATKGVLVLKGPMTRVTDVHATYCSPFGGPVLARGGSGDMLAGLIGGLLAQTPEHPVLAACRGVVWHGMAADLLARTHGQVAVENSQLLEQLGPALILTHARSIDGAAGVHGAERSA